MSESLYPSYFADPFVLQTDGRYVAFGSGRPPVAGAAKSGRVVECLVSNDLSEWRSMGSVLDRLPASFGDEYWAPEVAEADGAFWMFYSVGRGIEGHHLRVARADDATGPYRDLGISITPREKFAIDAHPFRDVDGRWYLFFARDVLDAERQGTQLAVAPLIGMTELGETTTVLEPFADWQLYERDRHIYGRQRDWHTLEGPSVVRRAGRYWLTYSGGAWTGDRYRVAWAVADAPLGPWTPAPQDAVPLLASGETLRGPGHNSLVTAPDGSDVIVFHSWVADARLMHARRISFEPDGPRVDGPIRGPSTSSA